MVKISVFQLLHSLPCKCSDSLWTIVFNTVEVVSKDLIWWVNLHLLPKKIGCSTILTIFTTIASIKAKSIYTIHSILGKSMPQGIFILMTSWIGAINWLLLGYILLVKGFVLNSVNLKIIHSMWNTKLKKKNMYQWDIMSSSHISLHHYEHANQSTCWCVTPIS